MFPLKIMNSRTVDISYVRDKLVIGWFKYNVINISLVSLILLLFHLHDMRNSENIDHIVIGTVRSLMFIVNTKNISNLIG